MLIDGFREFSQDFGTFVIGFDLCSGADAMREPAAQSEAQSQAEEKAEVQPAEPEVPKPKDSFFDDRREEGLRDSTRIP